MSKFLLGATGCWAYLLLLMWASKNSGEEWSVGWQYTSAFYAVLTAHIAFFLWCFIKKKLKAAVLLWWAGFTIYPICLVIWNQQSIERWRLLEDLLNREKEYREAVEASPPPRSASAELFISKRRMNYLIAKARWDDSSTRAEFRSQVQYSWGQETPMPAIIAGIPLTLFLLTWRFFKTEDVL